MSDSSAETPVQDLLATMTAASMEAGARRWGDTEHTVLRETAVWLGISARLTRNW